MCLLSPKTHPRGANNNWSVGAALSDFFILGAKPNNALNPLLLGLPNRGVRFVSRNPANEQKPDFLDVRPVARDPPNKHLMSEHPTPTGADDERSETFAPPFGWAESFKHPACYLSPERWQRGANY